jgi:hypothetical protein
VVFGEYNPLTILAQGYSCKDIIVTTDNGSIYRDDNSNDCQFNYYPLKLGNATIHVAVKTKHGIKHIGDNIFRVKQALQFEARLLGKKDGEISKTLLLNGIAPLGIILNSTMDAQVFIPEFTVYIVRNNEILYSEKCLPAKFRGARFTTETIDHFGETRDGDIIFITGMKGMFFDNKPFSLNDIRLTVVE